MRYTPAALLAAPGVPPLRCAVWLGHKLAVLLLPGELTFCGTRVLPCLLPLVCYLCAVLFSRATSLLFSGYPELLIAAARPHPEPKAIAASAHEGATFALLIDPLFNLLRWGDHTLLLASNGLLL